MHSNKLISREKKNQTPYNESVRIIAVNASSYGLFWFSSTIFIHDMPYRSQVFIMSYHAKIGTMLHLMSFTESTGMQPDRLSDTAGIDEISILYSRLLWVVQQWYLEHPKKIADHFKNSCSFSISE